jgi:sulfur dioxygenase
MLFRQLFDSGTSTYTYLVADLQTSEAALVDPVLEQVERDILLLQQLGLTLRYCLDTHVHADHITGAGELRQRTGCTSIVPEKAKVDCANRFMADRELLQIGVVKIEAIATPGHTDSHLAYLVNDSYLLTGDALLIRGCGRTDFQSGDAGALFDSVTQRLFTFPDSTLVYPGHDYRGHTVSTIGEEKRWNPRFLGRNREQFQEFMHTLNLPSPQRMAEAVPANERCGDSALASA